MSIETRISTTAKKHECLSPSFLNFRTIIRNLIFAAMLAGIKHAETVNLNTGWNLKNGLSGTPENLVANNPGINHIWHYDGQNWSLYHNEQESISELNNYPRLNLLDPNEYYWLKLNNTENIDIPLSTNSKSISSSYTISSVDRTMASTEFFATNPNVNYFFTYSDGKYQYSAKDKNYERYVGSLDSSLAITSEINQRASLILNTKSQEALGSNSSPGIYSLTPSSSTTNLSQFKFQGIETEIQSTDAAWSSELPLVDKTSLLDSLDSNGSYEVVLLAKQDILNGSRSLMSGEVSSQTVVLPLAYTSINSSDDLLNTNVLSIEKVTNNQALESAKITEVKIKDNLAFVKTELKADSSSLTNRVSDTIRVQLNSGLQKLSKDFEIIRDFPAAFSKVTAFNQNISQNQIYTETDWTSIPVSFSLENFDNQLSSTLPFKIEVQSKTNTRKITMTLNINSQEGSYSVSDEFWNHAFEDHTTTLSAMTRPTSDFTISGKEIKFDLAKEIDIILQLNGKDIPADNYNVTLSVNNTETIDPKYFSVDGKKYQKFTFDLNLK